MNVDMQMKMREAIRLIDDLELPVGAEAIEAVEALNRNRLKTPAEFARMTGLSYKCVMKLVKEKGFPAFHLLENSRNYLIDMEAVPAWLQKQMKKPKRPLGM